MSEEITIDQTRRPASPRSATIFRGGAIGTASGLAAALVNMMMYWLLPLFPPEIQGDAKFFFGTLITIGFTTGVGVLLAYLGVDARDEQYALTGNTDVLKVRPLENGIRSLV